MKESTRADVLFVLVVLYILVAGGWWSYLLYIKNEDALTAKKTVLWYQMKEKGVTEEEFLVSSEYEKLSKQYSRQQWMIMGEGAVLLIFTILGIRKLALSRQKELALANQQRNFLLSITHELKSPIASIQLVFNTFQRRQLKPEQTQKLTKNGLADTERLHKLVQDLLLAARMEGGYQYSFLKLDLVNLVQKCILLVEHKFDGEILIQNEQKNHYINGDETTLMSMVLNLLENAIKYAKKSTLIEVAIFDKRRRTFLEVKDQGEGIPKAERGRIFDKFYRIGDENTRQTKGTGVGLYIVQRVAMAHKGHASVRGNTPQGAIFSINLPRLI